jgi:hypothetical protein
VQEGVPSGLTVIGTTVSAGQWASSSNVDFVTPFVVEKANAPVNVVRIEEALLLDTF